MATMLKQEKPSIKDDMLELLNDSKIKEYLLLNKIEIKAINDIIEHNYFLSKIKRYCILNKEKEYKDREKFVDFITNELGYSFIIENHYDNYIDPQNFSIIKFIAISLFYDMLDIILDIKESKEPKNQQKFELIHKHKKDLEHFLISYFDLPKNKDPKYHKDKRATSIVLAMECHNYSELIEFIYGNKEYQLSELEMINIRFDTNLKIENNEIININPNKILAFNEISGLNIKENDFGIFEAMVNSYFIYSISDKFSTKTLLEQINTALLKMNEFFKLGIKKEINQNEFYNSVKRSLEKNS